MSEKRRTTKTRGFSLGTEASEAIDNYAERENMTKSMVVERAVLEYTQRERSARIESKVDEILDRLDEGAAPTSADSTTHTQTDSKTSSKDEVPESDGGTAAVSGTGSRPGVFESLEEYSPDHPGDHEISREALKEAPAAVGDGLVINPDHVDYATLQSKGVQVAVKSAVCAGILRYNYSGGITEDQIRDTAEDVLGGRRNANRHFDAITQYLCASPVELDEFDADMLSKEPDPLLKKMCATKDTYAPSEKCVLEAYYSYQFSSTADTIQSANDQGTSHKNLRKCNGGLGYLFGRRENLMTHAFDTPAEFVENYHQLVRETLETQDLDDTDVTFRVIGSDTEVDSIEAFERELERAGHQPNADTYQTGGDGE